MNFVIFEEINNMKKILLLLATTFMSLSCLVAPKTEKLVWDVNNKMDNVFFIGENFDYYKNGQDYMKFVENEFNNRNIKNVGYFYNERVLNAEKKLRTKIEMVNPKYILTISLTAITKGNGKTYSLSLFDTEKKKEVWEDYVLGSAFDGPRKFSKNLMVKLEKEKIINKIK